MPYFSLNRGVGQFSPHASTHHQGGTDAISAEAIGARPAGANIDWGEIAGLSPLTNAEITDLWTWGPEWYIRYPGVYGFNIYYTAFNDQISFQGLVARASGKDLLIGSLGEGFRPNKRKLFGALTMRQLPTDSIRSARVGIFPNGDVRLELDNQNSSTYIYSDGLIDWVSLDGISFFI